MEMFVLVTGKDFDASYVLGVYTTLEAAQAAYNGFMVNAARDGDFYDYGTVHKIVVDIEASIDAGEEHYL
jgi:hypothetical protein